MVSSNNDVFIRGFGSAIPGLDDERIQNGKGGILFPVETMCSALKDRYKIHNPKSGKSIDRDWARRNLGVETISLSSVQKFCGMLKENNLFEGLQDDLKMKLEGAAVDVSENELAFTAFEEALDRSNMKASDIDAIIRVSPSEGDVYFWSGARVWKEKYPELKHDVRIHHHPLGCPAFLVELKFARELLEVSSIKNVAIVISSCGSIDVDQKYIDLHTMDNDLSKWANLVIFGDGASACIVSRDQDNLPKTVYDVIDVDYKNDHTQWISSRDDSFERPVYYLNVNGPKHIKTSVNYWTKIMKDRHGLVFNQADHVALHTANPKVLRRLAADYGIEKKVSYLPDRVGNLGPASCMTNLHDRLYSGQAEIKNGDLISGYALGAALGLTDGVFLLRVRDTFDDDTCSSTEKSSLGSGSMDLSNQEIKGINKKSRKKGSLIKLASPFKLLRLRSKKVQALSQ